MVYRFQEQMGQHMRTKVLKSRRNPSTLVRGVGLPRQFSRGFNVFLWKSIYSLGQNDAMLDTAIEMQYFKDLIQTQGA